MPTIHNNISLDTLKKTIEHPCFNPKGHQFARIHLPIAPKCNIQCNYCNRKYDCQNENRPGVSSEVLNPEEALERYKYAKKKIPNLKVVGIAGPGDTLANFEETKKTLELIKAYDPDVTLCLSTNGMMLSDYADDLLKLGVTHLTVTMNTIDPKIGAKIYEYVTYNGKKYEGEEGAAFLLEKQLEGIKKLHNKDILLKINVVAIKGVNYETIEDLVTKLKVIGVNYINIMSMIPVSGTPFENVTPLTKEEIHRIRTLSAKYLPQMYHCKKCRADAAGMLKDKCPMEQEKLLANK